MSNKFSNIIIISGRIKIGFYRIATFLSLRDDTIISASTTFDDYHVIKYDDYVSKYMPIILKNKGFCKLTKCSDSTILHYLEEKYNNITTIDKLYSFSNFGYIMPCLVNHVKKVQNNIKERPIKIIYGVRKDPIEWFLLRYWSGNLGHYHKSVKSAVLNHVESVFSSYDYAMDTMKIFPTIVIDMNDKINTYNKIAKFIGFTLSKLQKLYINNDVKIGLSGDVDIITKNRLCNLSYDDFREKYINHKDLHLADTILNHKIYNYL